MLSDNCDLIMLITGGDSGCNIELVQHQKHKGAQFSRRVIIAMTYIVYTLSYSVRHSRDTGRVQQYYSSRRTKVSSIVLIIAMFYVYILNYSMRARIEMHLYTELQCKFATATQYRFCANTLRTQHLQCHRPT